MKRSMPVLLLVAACGGSSNAPPAVPNVPLPSGDALRPWDPQHPGLARPLGIAQVNGTAYAALGNYDASFAARGPGLLAAFVPSNGTVTLIDLGGAADKECIQAGWVRTADGLLYVTCSGDFNTGSGNAVVEVNPSGQGTVTKRFAAPVSPAGVAITSNRVWFGSGLSGVVYGLDRATFALAAGPITLTCPATSYKTTNDLAVLNGELYAVCSNDVGGVLNRLDATTGTVKGTADSGPIAAALTATGDGRLAIVSSGDNRLRLVTVSPTQMTVQVAYQYSDQTATLQGISALNQFVYTTASDSNTVQKIDISGTGGARLVDEKSVGSCNQGTGDCPGPWNILPLDDDQALVTNQRSSTIVAVKWSH
jgi:glutamine cyclotransferase